MSNSSISISNILDILSPSRTLPFRYFNIDTSAFNNIDNYPFITNPIIYNNYPISTYSDENNFYYSIEVPGFTKNNLKVTVNDSQVNISGECENNKKSISKSFTIDKTLNIDSIYVKLENGILTISFLIIKHNNNTNEKNIQIN